MPIEESQLICGSYPIEVTIKDYSGNTESVIQIENIDYKFDYDYSTKLSLTIFGIKTYSGISYGADMFNCKLYDEEGYLVDTAYVSLLSLNEGDKFKNDSVIFYNVTPGETYTISFEDINY